MRTEDIVKETLNKVAEDEVKSLKDKMNVTEEEQRLLIKDLCARLPYITFVYVEWHEMEELVICDDCEDNEEEPNIHTLISCDHYGECNLDDGLYKTIDEIKPYLRPMSSMTEEEHNEYQELYDYEERSYNQGCEFYDEWKVEMDDEERLFKITDWLNAHHFDYRGLIGMGLALPAPEGMYNN